MLVFMFLCDGRIVQLDTWESVVDRDPAVLADEPRHHFDLLQILLREIVDDWCSVEVVWPVEASES